MTPPPDAEAPNGPAVLPTLMRVRFNKRGKVRFTSHRDVARIWERALRRAVIPVAYSAGFSPRPRISFGLALPTGYESDAEYLDVHLDPARLDPSRLAVVPGGTLAETARPTPAPGWSAAGTLTAALPTGMAVLAVALIRRGGPSLQHAVTSCTWRIEAAGAGEREASMAVRRALDAPTLFVERVRKGRTVVDDIRPSLVSAGVEHGLSDGVRITADLGTQPRATRPTELLAGLSPPLQALRVRRLHQWIATDTGQRHEPLTGVSG